jgi:hypothetical protein
LFENRVLRKVFLLKWDDKMGGWKEVHKEELRDLLPGVISMIMLWMMRWEVHIVGTRD